MESTEPEEHLHDSCVNQAPDFFTGTEAHCTRDFHPSQSLLSTRDGLQLQVYFLNKVGMPPKLR